MIVATRSPEKRVSKDVNHEDEETLTWNLDSCFDTCVLHCQHQAFVNVIYDGVSHPGVWVMACESGHTVPAHEHSLGRATLLLSCHFVFLPSDLLLMLLSDEKVSLGNLFVKK
jgi:hypothetical protein